MRTYSTLEQLRTTLTLIGGGHHSEVYRATSDVWKVYRKMGLRARELNNFQRAGLADWVVDSQLCIEDHEILVMRAFEGRPATAATLPAAIPAVLQFVHHLHRPRAEAPWILVERVRQKLQRFASLRDAELEPLFVEVEQALAAGILEVPAVLCHLDLWSDNVLVSDQEAFIIDWVRADWDDAMRDLALLKAGTLDLLSADESLQALQYYPRSLAENRRLRAYIALTYLHDIHWIGSYQPETLSSQRPFKVERAYHTLAHLG